MVGPITDLARTSVLAPADVRAQIEAAIAGDGSSTEALRLERLGVGLDGETFVIEIGAAVVERLGRVAKGRLGHGRRLLLGINDDHLTLAPGAAVCFDSGVLTLSPPAVEALALAKPKRGRYPLVPGLDLLVHPTKVFSADGSHVAMEIG